MATSPYCIQVLFEQPRASRFGGGDQDLGDGDLTLVEKVDHESKLSLDQEFIQLRELNPFDVLSDTAVDYGEAAAQRKIVSWLKAIGRNARLSAKRKKREERKNRPSGVRETRKKEEPIVTWDSDGIVIIARAATKMWPRDYSRNIVFLDAGFDFVFALGCFLGLLDRRSNLH